MMAVRQITAVLLLLALLAEKSHTRTLTFLRHDVHLPGPSMRFNESLGKGIFEFEFKTFAESALVLYQDDQGMSDYVQLVLNQGKLSFSFYASKNRTPGTQGYFTSEKRYNDFEWHSVRIERNASITKLIVDHGMEAKQFKTNDETSMFTSSLLLGGLHADQYLNDLSSPNAFDIYAKNHGSEHRGFFDACVRNIRYGETQSIVRDITSEYIQMNWVSEGCHLNHCHNKHDPICQNNGRCFPRKNSVTCDCRQTGYTGTNCTKRALELSLDGTYKMRYHFVRRNSKRETYAFRIKTFQRDAILFYARGLPHLPDFMLIEIKSSRLHIVLNVGDFDERGLNHSVTSSVLISDGKWHFVKYAKNSTHFALTIDETSTTTVEFNPWYRTMDYDDHSWLGEIARKPYKHKINIVDFTWKLRKNGKEVNFVTGLYNSYGKDNAEFSVLPSDSVPKFNRELPVIIKEVSEFAVNFVLVNNRRADVLVTTNSTIAQIETDLLKPGQIVVKSKKWSTKTPLCVSAVDTGTDKKVHINGRHVVHLQSSLAERISLKVLYIEAD